MAIKGKMKERVEGSLLTLSRRVKDDTDDEAPSFHTPAQVIPAHRVKFEGRCVSWVGPPPADLDVEAILSRKPPTETHNARVQALADALNLTTSQATDRLLEIALLTTAH